MKHQNCGNPLTPIMNHIFLSKKGDTVIRSEVNPAKRRAPLQGGPPGVYRHRPTLLKQPTWGSTEVKRLSIIRQAPKAEGCGFRVGGNIVLGAGGTAVAMTGLSLGCGSSSYYVYRNINGWCHLLLAKAGSGLEAALGWLGPWPTLADVRRVLCSFPLLDVSSSFWLSVKCGILHVTPSHVVGAFRSSVLPLVTMEGEALLMELVGCARDMSGLDLCVDVPALGGDIVATARNAEVRARQARVDVALAESRMREAADHARVEVLSLGPGTIEDVATYFSGFRLGGVASSTPVEGGDDDPFIIGDEAPRRNLSIFSDIRTISLSTRSASDFCEVVRTQSRQGLARSVPFLTICANRVSESVANLGALVSGPAADTQGFCWRFLFDNPPPGPPYIRVSTLLAESAFIEARADTRLWRWVHFRRYDGIFHISKTPFEGSMRLTLCDVWNILGGDPGYRVGVEVKPFYAFVNRFWDTVFTVIPYPTVRPTMRPGLCYRHLIRSTMWQMSMGLYPRLACLLGHPSIRWMFEQGLVEEQIHMSWSNGVFHMEKAAYPGSILVDVGALMTYFENPTGGFMCWGQDIMLDSTVGGLISDQPPPLPLVGIILLGLAQSVPLRYFSGSGRARAVASSFGVLCLMLWAMSCGLGLMLADAVLAILLVVTVGLVACTITGVFLYDRDTPVIHLVTHGSRGDRVPIDYYARWLHSIGAVVSIVHSVDDEDGKVLLANVEEGRFYSAVGFLPPFLRAINERLDLGSNHYVFAPLGGMGYPDRVGNYDLSPPPRLINMFRLAPFLGFWWDILNFVVTFLQTVGDVDIRIGSFRGCAPRSCDGLTLLSPMPNRGTRETLVCMGSSSEGEPHDLDPMTTWSTRCDSIYPLDERTNHNEMMRDYKTVICHGGAGTMATARAAGCVAKSVSRMLDRDYRANVEWVFDTSRALFLLGVMKRMSPSHSVRLFLMVWRQLDLYDAGVLIWLLMLHYVTLAYCFIVGMVYVLGPMFRGLLAAQNVDIAIDILLLPPGVAPFSRLLVVPVLGMFLKFHLRRHDLPATTGLFLKCGQLFGRYIGDPVFWHLAPVIGAPLATMLAYAVRTVQTRLHAPLLYAGVCASRFALNTTIRDDRFLELRFVPFTSMFGGWFPIAHVELADSRTERAIGVTVEGTRTLAYDRRADPRYGYALTTTIRRDKLDTVLEMLTRGNGTIYNPLNTCQTSLFRVLWSVSELVGVETALLCVYITLTFCVLMPVAGLVMLACSTLGILGVGSAALVAEAAPLLHAAGGEQGGWTLHDVMLYFFCPSVSESTIDRVKALIGSKNPECLVKPPLRPGEWPDVAASTAALEYSDKVFTIKTPLGRWAVQGPVTGLHRPEASLDRDGSSRLIHGLMRGLSGPTDPRVGALRSALDSGAKDAVRTLELSGAVVCGVVACSRERPLDIDFVARMLENIDAVIILTNEAMLAPFARSHVLVLDTSGRGLALARELMPAVDGVTWFALNYTLPPEWDLFIGLLLASRRELAVFDFITASPRALHQCCGGCVIYRTGSTGEGVWDVDVYGVDELVWIKRKGLIYSRLNRELLTHSYATQDFGCDREIRFVSGRSEKFKYRVTNWATVNHIRGLESSSIADVARPMWVVESGRLQALDVDGARTDMTPGLVTVLKMYGGGVLTVHGLLTELRRNARHVIIRLRHLHDYIVKSVIMGNAIENVVSLYMAIDSVLDILSPGSRRPKVVWAPILNALRIDRVAELGVRVHPSPSFKMTDYNDTLIHYIAALNDSRAALSSRDFPRLSLHEFRREVNRNPYIDLNLRQRCHELGAVDGVDGQVFACREVMIATLARYVGSPGIDALDIGEKEQIASAIVKRNPALYERAELADPHRLFNHFMKHKNYSAGLPFSGRPSGGDAPIKSRADMRKAGWMKAMEAYATLPLTSGVWFPSISHAFPKSQVISTAKLLADPAKLRSVTATSPLFNIAKGVINFDVNNRHDYRGAPSKVGMPLNGTHMGRVFSELNRYSHKASADITAMDSNINASVFGVEALIRKAGFREHPACEAIFAHIDCMMEATQRGYIVNLVTEPLESALESLDDYHKGIVGRVTPEVWDEVKRRGDIGVIDHASAPGGVVRKTKGGYTGDSDTTWTNTLALQIIIMKCLNAVHGVKYEDFFNQVFLANVGDDNLIGLDFQADFVGIQESAAQIFGVTLRLEGVGDILNHQFLGKVPAKGSRHAADFEMMGMQTPEFAILHNRATLLMRYGNYKAEVARRTKRSSERYIYLLEHCLGYLGLVAHQKDLYDQIIADMDGYEARVAPAIRGAKWFKRKFKRPTYLKVLQDWYKDADVSGLDTMTKLRFHYGFVSRSEKIMCEFFRTVERFTVALPTQLFNLEDPKLLDEAMDWDNSMFIFESHAWHCFVTRTGRTPTLVELVALCRQSPFDAFTAPRAFLETIVPTLATSGEVFERTRANSQNRLILYSAIYYQTNRVLDLLNLVPYGSAVLAMFNAYTFGLPKLYSSLNYLNYVAKGESSLNVSRMMPKDFYHNHKRLAHMVTRLVPEVPATDHVRLAPFVDVVSAIIEMISKGAVATLTAGDAGLAPTRMDDGPWRLAAHQAITALGSKQAAIVVAATGTGKTMLLPQTFLGMSLRGSEITQVVVVMPRRVLCEDYSKNGGVLYKRRGIQLDDSRLVTLTYGHLVALYTTTGLVEFGMGTLFLLDECHEKSCEVQFMVQSLMGLRPVVMMSATPNLVLEDRVERIDVDVERRFKVNYHEVKGYTPLALFSEVVRSRPGRYLIIDPRIAYVERLALTLVARGFPAKAVTSKDRSVPDDETIHVVATSIVDAGINIKGLVGVIDTGFRLGNHDGALVARHVDNVTMVQRAGRTGRFCDGDYYVLSNRDQTQFDPAPSVEQCVSDSPLVVASRIKINLTRNMCGDEKKLPQNEYVHLRVPLRETRKRMSLGLFHALVISSKTRRAAKSLYKRATEGISDDATEFYMTMCKISHSALLTLAEVIELDKYHLPQYLVDGRFYRKEPVVQNRTLTVLVYHTAPIFPPSNETEETSIKGFTP